MTKEEYTLETIRCQLSYILESVEKLPGTLLRQEDEELPEFVTLELAARVKGGAMYNTYRSRYYLQPCGGHEERPRGRQEMLAARGRHPLAQRG